MGTPKKDPPPATETRVRAWAAKHRVKLWEGQP